MIYVSLNKYNSLWQIEKKYIERASRYFKLDYLQSIMALNPNYKNRKFHWIFISNKKEKKKGRKKVAVIIIILYPSILGHKSLTRRKEERKKKRRQSPRKVHPNNLSRRAICRETSTWSRVISFLYEKIVIPPQIRYTYTRCISLKIVISSINTCVDVFDTRLTRSFRSQNRIFTREILFRRSSQNWRSSISISLKRKDKTSFAKILQNVL